MKNAFIYTLDTNEVFQQEANKLKDAVGNELFLPIGIRKLTAASQSGTTGKYR